MRKLLPLLIVVILILSVGVFFSGTTELNTKQPIEFSHKKHRDIELPCSVCHQYFEEHASAGIPGGEICMTCHTVALTQNPEEEKIREYAKQGVEIKWVRLYRVPNHVYFSHRRHVVLGKLECTTCHGGIGESIKPPLGPEVELTMDMCIACHQKMGADTDCYACHR